MSERYEEGGSYREGGVRNRVGGGGGHTENCLLFVSLFVSLYLILTLAIVGAIHSLMLLTALHIHRTAFGA